MEFINDINIQEAIIHVLDKNENEPVLNEFNIELTEDIYKFLHKHCERCLKDEELKTAIFNKERNIVKEIVQDYLNGMDKDLVGLSKELARQLFAIMNNNINIPSCDLIVVCLITDQGPLIGILKMDYVKNFTHSVNFIDSKIGIDIVPQISGLPASGSKIQKAAFIKPIRENQQYDLFVIDKQRKNKKDEEYGSNYFINSFLGCSVIANNRDKTKALLKASETWTRNNITEDAELAEKIRSTIKNKLREEDHVNINEMAEELFGKNLNVQSNYSDFLKSYGLEEDLQTDKEWAKKKLERVRIKIDKDIDLYISEEAYNDESRFEIQRNGDGSINMIIKHVVNYMEK